MMRTLHRWPGLVLAALLFVTALSGAALSLFPALEAVQAPATADTLTVADLATRVQATHPGLEQIKRAPSGRITAWWFDGDQPGSAVIDPATGRDVASADPSPVQRWLTTLHRSLFLGDAGRLLAATDQITLQFGPEFSKNPPIEPIKIIHLIQNNRNYKLAGQDKISLLRHCPSLNDKVAAVKDMIRELTK